MGNSHFNRSANSELDFKPHRLVRNTHLQTILPSIYRYNNGEKLAKSAEEMILVTGEGVRLQGYYSPQPAGLSEGLVLFLHGWLGSANSNYAVGLGDYLYQRGYSLFRLNFRDHGNTGSLNPGVFRADLLNEVVDAVQQIAQLEADRPFHIVGVSLGGNFALRLAWRYSQTPIPNLAHTIAICPVINGYNTTLALDNQPLYLPYFRREWRRMLGQKRQAFPKLYNSAGVLSARSCLAMTEAFVRQYSPYPNAQAYFSSYSIAPEMMAALQSPVSIIAAADDPIIPIADFDSLIELSAKLHLAVQQYGGHVGFMHILPFRIWLCEAIWAILKGDLLSV